MSNSNIHVMADRKSRKITVEESEVFRDFFPKLATALKCHLKDLLPHLYAERIISSGMLEDNDALQVVTAIDNSIKTGRSTAFETTMKVLKTSQGTKHIAEDMEKALGDRLSKLNGQTRPQNLSSKSQDAPNTAAALLQAHQKSSMDNYADQSHAVAGAKSHAKEQPKNITVVPVQSTCHKGSQDQLASAEQYMTRQEVEALIREMSNTQQIDQNTQQIKKLEEINSDIKKDLKEKDFDIQSLRKKLEEKDSDIQSLRKELEEVRKERNHLTEELSNVKDELEVVKEQLSKVREELEIVKGRERDLRYKTENMEKEKEELEKELKKEILSLHNVLN